MAVEVRYVGTRARPWRTADDNGGADLNYNEFNIVENGFLNEFRRAQGNLQANIAAGLRQHVRIHRRARHSPAADLPGLLQRPGRRRTPATRRSIPAPIGRTGRSSDSWRRATRIRSGSPRPTPRTGCRGTRRSAATRSRRGSRRTTSSPIRNQRRRQRHLEHRQTRYNAVQFEFRRRYAEGLQFNGSYAYGHAVLQQGDQLPPGSGDAAPTATLATFRTPSSRR